MMGMPLGGLKVVELMGPIDAIDGVATDPPERLLSKAGDRSAGAAMLVSYPARSLRCAAFAAFVLRLRSCAASLAAATGPSACHCKRARIRDTITT